MELLEEGGNPGDERPTVKGVGSLGAPEGAKGRIVLEFAQIARDEDEEDNGEAL